MLDKPHADGENERVLRRKALESAMHSHAMEGMIVEPTRYPEFEAIVEGTMSFDEAAKAIADRYRKV